MGAIIDANHRGGCRDDEFSHNLEWGTLMQIVSPNFQKLPLGIHQNTPFKAKKSNFFLWEEGFPIPFPGGPQFWTQPSLHPKYQPDLCL